MRGLKEKKKDGYNDLNGSNIARLVSKIFIENQRMAFACNRQGSLQEKISDAD